VEKIGLLQTNLLTSW